MIMLISASLTKTFKKTSVTFENIPLYPYTPLENRSCFSNLPQ